MEETPLESAPTFAPNKRKINNRFIYLIVAVVAVILLFLGFKFISGGSTETTKRAPTPTVTPILIPTDTPAPTSAVSETPTPTDTPTPKDTPTVAPTQNPVDKTTGLNRSKLSATVQNGSGEAGVAGKGSDFLKNLGYNVSATGNADNFNYTNVTIKVKAGSSDYLALLKKDLSSGYSVDSATSDLDNSFSTDALVIIGK